MAVKFFIQSMMVVIATWATLKMWKIDDDILSNRVIIVMCILFAVLENLMI